MAAAPAVGTDGSAAEAAVDHGCLLVIVWLQCGTTTIYTYMNTLQLQSKINPSPSSFLQGIPTESASGNSSFDHDSRFLLLLLSTLDFPPIWQTVVRGKQKAAELLPLFHTCCRAKSAFSTIQASKQASKQSIFQLAPTSIYGVCRIEPVFLYLVWLKKKCETNARCSQQQLMVCYSQLAISKLSWVPDGLGILGPYQRGESQSQSIL